MLLCSPDTIHHILDVQNEISLAVSSVTERHVRRVRLRDGCQSQMWRPRLDQNHVACDETRAVGTAPRVCFAVKHHSTIPICRISQNLMEVNCKSVQMSNVERTEVGMEGVVQQGIVDREVHRTALFGWRRRLRQRGSLGWGSGLFQCVWERRSGIRRKVIRSEIETICWCQRG